MKIYLTLVLLIFSFLISSCKFDVDSEFTATYIFKNNTAENVEFIVMGDIVENEKLIDSKIKTYVIIPFDSLIFKIQLPTNTEIADKPTNILKRNNILGDSLIITFNVDRSLFFFKDSVGKDRIYEEENYLYDKVDAYAVTFEYNFY